MLSHCGCIWLDRHGVQYAREQKNAFWADFDSIFSRESINSSDCLFI